MQPNEIIWPKSGATVKIISSEPQEVYSFDPRTSQQFVATGIPVEITHGCLSKTGLLTLPFLFGTEILSTSGNGETVKHHFKSELQALQELKGCTLKFYHGRSASGRYWRLFRIVR